MNFAKFLKTQFFLRNTSGGCFCLFSVLKASKLGSSLKVTEVYPTILDVDKILFQSFELQF